MLQTNEYDAWREGEEGAGGWCDWCGEASETESCGTCQEAYELEQARRADAAQAWYADEERAQAQRWADEAYNDDGLGAGGLRGPVQMR